MSNPNPYVPSYSFGGYQTSSPTKPLPATKLDNELFDISASLNAAIAGLADVRRSDGALKNSSVGPDQISPTLSVGFSFRGIWADGESYAAGDGVVYDSVFYRAQTAHVADSSNRPDLAPGLWAVLINVADIAVTGAISMPVNRFTGDGVTKTFALSFTPLSAANVFAKVGGVVQDTTEYSVDGNDLTFVTAPGNGWIVEARGFATSASLTVPEDGSVTLPKLDAGVSTTIQGALQSTANFSDIADKDAALVNLGLPARAFDSVSAAEAATIGTGIDALIVGGKNYVRVTAGTPDAFQSADGAWWGPVLIDAVLPVADRTALKAVDTTAHTAVYFEGSTWYAVDYADFSTLVDADTQEGIFARCTSDTAKAFVRSVDGRANAKWFGAIGDGVADDTAALRGFRDVLQKANLPGYIPAGTYLTDYIGWGYVAGASAVCDIVGAGPKETILKKKTADGEGLFELNENTLDHQTFGVASRVRGMSFEGIPGDSAFSFRAVSLTASRISDVQAYSSLVGISLKNCVTATFENVVARSNVDGWVTEKTPYGDASVSATNVITLITCKATDNSGWGVKNGGGSQIVALNPQIENNGTDGTMSSGGLWVLDTAGDLGTNRLGKAWTQLGGWIENNHGGQAARLDGGLSSFHGTQWVANDVRELYNRGGKYVLYACSMVNPRTGGNILDDATLGSAGNLILGGEIADLSGILSSKTSTLGVNYGSGATPSFKAPLVTQGATQEIVQSGAATCSGGTVDVTFPVAFSAAPKVIAVPFVNASGRAYSAKVYGITAIGFTLQMQYVESGSATVVDSNDAAMWVAVGQL